MYGRFASAVVTGSKKEAKENTPETAGASAKESAVQTEGEIAETSTEQAAQTSAEEKPHERAGEASAQRHLQCHLHPAHLTVFLKSTPEKSLRIRGDQDALELSVSTCCLGATSSSLFGTIVSTPA
jgi:hypothetical protein